MIKKEVFVAFYNKLKASEKLLLGFSFFTIIAPHWAIFAALLIVGIYGYCLFKHIVETK